MYELAVLRAVVPHTNPQDAVAGGPSASGTTVDVDGGDFLAGLTGIDLMGDGLTAGCGEGIDAFVGVVVEGVSGGVGTELLGVHDVFATAEVDDGTLAFGREVAVVHHIIEAIAVEIGLAADDGDDAGVVATALEDGLHIAGHVVGIDDGVGNGGFEVAHGDAS